MKKFIYKNSKYLLVLTIMQWNISICCSSSKQNRNVLVLLADDAGLESPVYGNNAIQTPNLVKLAEKGTVFNSAYTSVSSCSPSRSAILTGLPTHQNGMYGLHNGYHHFNSFSRVKSLPVILRRKGIRTGIIGKKHVGPSKAYRFDYEETEENNSIMQVGRNITRIKELVYNFLENSKNQSFFLYVGFHDPHRCAHTHPEYGDFCEKFGNGNEGMGLIPDWNPIYYDPKKVKVPFFVQDTNVTRLEIAKQYTTISRLDQGIGLVLEALETYGLVNNTLIIYSSDNGIPFPAGRTNVYEPGIIEPFILYSPLDNSTHGKICNKPISLLDIVPTVLEWFNVTYPTYSINKKDRVRLTGKPLIRYLENSDLNEEVFVSHNLHEITMYYPMRAIRKKNFKLIHNLNYRMPFPIDQDFYLSKSFQEILFKSVLNKTLNWYKTLEGYYYRPEWELYDLENDSMEMKNLIDNSSYWPVYYNLQMSLHDWQNKTNDPWLCSPHGILQDTLKFKHQPTCFPLFNYIK